MSDYKLNVRPEESYSVSYTYKKWETKGGDVVIEMRKEKGERSWTITFPQLSYLGQAVYTSRGDLERLQDRVYGMLETAHSDLKQLMHLESQLDVFEFPQCRALLEEGEKCFNCGSSRPRQGS